MRAYHLYQRLSCLIGFVLILSGCTGSEEPRIVYVTATPEVTDGSATLTYTATVPVPTPIIEDASNPTADPPRAVAQNSVVNAEEHIVQAGDTLTGIAQSYGVSLNSLLETNNIENPDSLFVGQIIQLPDEPTTTTPNVKILSDARLVRAPGIIDFDLDTFIQSQPGYIRIATDEVMTRLADGSERIEVLNATQIVERVSLNFSVDPRILLALLEYRAGWLSESQRPINLVTHPLITEDNSGSVDRSGLYKQLNWAANVLNAGYYGWRVRAWSILEFSDGTRLRYDDGLNAGTVGVYYFLSRFTAYDEWLTDISRDGFFATYVTYFGDPFADVIDPVVPEGLAQPNLTLPFAAGETWFFTGGAHGGWGGGSAWSAIDFAPPDEPPQGILCYTSNYWARAVAQGLIVRSGNGSVILDLDGDGDESTGWVILYLHIAEEGRVSVGTYVNAGDTIGRPACSGGFSTATHLHIARRFNGEWISADCLGCSANLSHPPFIMSNWQVVALLNQEYQGYLENNGQRRIAEQGRLTPDNRVSW